MNKKIECIKRLIDRDRFYEFSDWFIEHKLIKKEDIIGLDRSKEKAEFIYEAMKRAEKEEKLILLDFEWSLLPLEVIRITCVTEVEKKEFTYGL